jgi:hypothetical protein
MNVGAGQDWLNFEERWRSSMWIKVDLLVWPAAIAAGGEKDEGRVTC